MSVHRDRLCVENFFWPGAAAFTAPRLRLFEIRKWPDRSGEDQWEVFLIRIGSQMRRTAILGYLDGEGI
ncbi:hypothetical protein YP76_05555 [Sphingobium chungbukense]|uniref:Uncharacterized protein n=1 Tax=Sphingobium chungbukense TaxID=56193 RepID=A0A0M3AYR1_9SPHN|nr:hypothetical protein YP76_05555 [Sphingobium chungbukense]